MNKEDIKRIVRKFIEDTIRFKEFENGDNIFKKGFVNSLFAVQLVMLVEKEFDLNVDNDDLDVANFCSVDNITAFVLRKNNKMVLAE